MTDRLKKQLAGAPAAAWPDPYSKWGGGADQKFDATGFVRTHHDGRRWWLVDPDGHAFWSAGPNCVTPTVQTNYHGLAGALEWLPDAAGPYRPAHYRNEGDGFDYLRANLIRAFGAGRWRDDWATSTLGRMKQLGFNTVGNWSDWRHARDARFPYVRPLRSDLRGVPNVYRDFPDVFDPAFDAAAAGFARQLLDTKDDPALIGYFLTNEPTWGFAGESPAAGMIFTTDGGATRRALAEHLRGKYADEAALRAAWDTPVTFDRLAAGRWSPGDADARLNGVARDDLRAFSTVMVDKLFRTLGAACKKVDPNHLNLGARYHTVPPQWVLEGMKSFDVFGVNGYGERVDAERLAAASETVGKPVMIGEFHFGALDAGLPAPGLVHVRDQADRGRAYRAYVEHAAAQSWCVGAHYFQLYDQSALGRFDGETYNIGFLDVCNRPYDDLVAAARASHERLYRVADGKEKPYDDAPEYLPKLFN